MALTFAASAAGDALELEAALQSFHIAPGCQIQLVASEPQVIDPVAMRFDADGRLWVAEMRDYPFPPEEGQKPKSRIVVLEDRDGDGRYETSTTFAEDLLFVNGLQPWRDGVIATLSGEIVFLRDTDGDGRADGHETWFRGFSEQNPQLRASHPRLAPDKRIYVLNGLRGGEVVNPRHKAIEPLSLGGMDFRFDPLSGDAETVSGLGQFGQSFDDFGNRFVTSNRNPMIHVVLENRYLRRNPLFAAPTAVHDVCAAGADSRVFALTRAWTTSTLHAGQFTAACGLCVYLGDALPAEFYGNAFVCEPTGNLVHREIITPRGATFDGQPARDGVEFLASADEWFRPVALEVGPDGALYIADMYRAVIEHPQFMPEELRARRDLHDGKDRGRIYRVVPSSWKSDVSKPRLSQASNTELIKSLSHANAWWRTTAARLLYERQDRSVIPALEDLAHNAQQPQTRLEALWLLSGLNALSAEVVTLAISDSHPRVREHAVRLAERFLIEDPTLSDAVVALAGDDDARLRFQVALSIGEILRSTGSDSDRNKAAIVALSDIAYRDAADPWTRRAIASSLHGVADQLLVDALHRFSNEDVSEDWLGFVEDAGSLVGASGDAASVIRVLEAASATTSTASPPEVAQAVVIGLSAGLARGRKVLDAVLSNHADTEPLINFVAAIRATAAGTLQSPDENDAAAVQRSIRLLRYAPSEMAKATLGPLVSDRTVSLDVRRAALNALAAHRDPAVTDLLIELLSTATPSLRAAVIQSLLVTPPRAKALLARLESGDLAVTEIPPLAAQSLRRHRDEEIRERATALFAAASADRDRVIADYQPALQMTADPHRGRDVFKKECSGCHRVADVGVDVGPDIADSRVKSPTQLLTDILAPNQAIDSNYLGYSVITADGRVLTGIIAGETPTSITLRQQENKTVTLLRSEIDELQSSGMSLMPEGLERNVDIQQMADLISFIKNWRYLDGNTPLPGFDADSRAPESTSEGASAAAQR